ncbi:hypothetical protein [Corynebacterium auriscanis]|uniref:hypothetical protein n=1 Tax=Corynebacterium auriscanis TaxID=99807 RepID=UPI003CEB3259
MRNNNAFLSHKQRVDEKKNQPPTTQDAFTKDAPRPHKPGVRLTEEQMSQFRIALAKNNEKAQQVLERAVEKYIEDSQ